MGEGQGRELGAVRRPQPPIALAAERVRGQLGVGSRAASLAAVGLVPVKRHLVGQRSVDRLDELPPPVAHPLGRRRPLRLLLAARRAPASPLTPRSYCSRSWSALAGASAQSRMPPVRATSRCRWSPQLACCLVGTLPQSAPCACQVAFPPAPGGGVRGDAGSGAATPPALDRVRLLGPAPACAHARQGAQLAVAPVRRRSAAGLVARRQLLPALVHDHVHPPAAVLELGSLRPAAPVGGCLSTAPPILPQEAYCQATNLAQGPTNLAADGSILPSLPPLLLTPRSLDRDTDRLWRKAACAFAVVRAKDRAAGCAARTSGSDMAETPATLPTYLSV